MSHIKIRVLQAKNCKTNLQQGYHFLELFTETGVTIRGKDVETIFTGVSLEIPKGYLGLLKGLESFAMQGITTFENTIEPIYSGTIRVTFFNLTKYDFTIQPGDLIAKIVIVKSYDTIVEKVFFGEKQVSKSMEEKNKRKRFFVETSTESE